MMFSRKIWILGLLLLGLVLVPSVFATPPARFDDGWWGNTVVDNGNVMYDFLVPSIGLTGTATQPAVISGRAAKGTFVGSLNGGPEGVCQYNVATFTLPNDKSKETFRASMNRCTGGLKGLHLTGTGSVDFSKLPLFEGPWQGSFHIDP